MKPVETEKLSKIQGGGGISLGVGLIIVAGAIFVIGVIDGFFRPLKCNK